MKRQAPAHLSSPDTKFDNQDAEVLELSKLPSEGVDDNGKHGKPSKPSALMSRVRWTSTPVSPARQDLDPEDAPLIPEISAGPFSKLLFLWLGDLLRRGYHRPIEASDLYRLDADREAGHLADLLIANFERRRVEADEWNRRLDSGEYKPSAGRKLWWRFKAARLNVGRADGRRKASLAWALSDTFRWLVWSSGVLDCAAELTETFQPLVVRAIISYGQDAYNATNGVQGYTDSGIGRGVAMAIGLWLMSAFAGCCFQHYLWRTSKVGLLARGALIAAVYRKATTLSGRARVQLTNSKLISLISTDASRLDFAANFLHMMWVAPVQLVAIIILLLVQLGYSALPGVAFVFFIAPIQGKFMGMLLRYRKAALVHTDARVKLTQEMVSGSKLIKIFAWEVPYIAKLDGTRAKELYKLRSLLFLRAANSAVALGISPIAAVLSLTCYVLTHENTSAATTFTSLALFFIIRFPMMTFPMAVGTCMDAKAAIDRLQEVFEAETIDDVYATDETAQYAVEVVDGSFRFESRPEETPVDKKGKKKRNKKQPLAPELAAAALVPAPTDEKVTLPPPADAAVHLRNINLSIRRGSLVAIVGPVGAGKSALLQALIGEMKRVNGSVIFGGSVGYCAQQAWIMNSSVRSNILFGRPYDAARYRKVIKDACLEADLDMLPHGDQTQIGEKGITLSGGQKQRVNIARALYFDSDIVLYDDPLSAVDAHVGKHLFEHAIKNAAPGKTRVLVTHALHFLPQVDYVYCIENGQIAEHGTYNELESRQGSFARLMEEFGGEQTAEEEKEIAKEQDAIDTAKPKSEQKSDKHVLMQEEERLTGSVSGKSWKGFFLAANGPVTVPLLAAAWIAAQSSSVISSYTLVWWQQSSFGASWSNNDYMALFAGLSIGVSVLTFLQGCAAVMLFLNASRNLHTWAVKGIMRAPASMFDTTPSGRIMSRFTKDLDTIDNTMTDSFRILLVTLGGVGSSIVLILIVQQYFLIGLAVIVFCYYLTARYYRQTARETKRIDNLLRSELYAHFSESLTGLSSIRAYGEVDTFVRENARRMQRANSAYMMVIAARSWLQIRLDLFGSVLSLVVALIAVALRNTISPAQIGVSLSYVVALTGMFSYMIRQATEIENDMNSVERLLHYSTELDQEAPNQIKDTEPASSWPKEGAIKFNKVLMSYRPGLPPVLKGISLDIKAGEKIGLVGRTGSGKSSIMITLFRMVELLSGSIVIDGVDIATIGLEALRSKLALIPQDPLLFEGTIRTNLDPFKQYDDAKLNDALRRAWLIDRGDSQGKARFSLDTIIEDEGLNLSVGERSLVSLARALVRDAQIVLLDEATASVDFETDSKIQQTIASEFGDKTMIIIAHRLLTILSCDRICVMDAGRIAEFDTPAALFEKRGVFHGMCERSNINLQTIQQAHVARDRGRGVVVREDLGEGQSGR